MKLEIIYFSFVLSLITFILVFIGICFFLGERIEMIARLEIKDILFYKMEYKDTHSGPRNEGEELAKIRLTEKKKKRLLKKVQKNTHWKELPMNANLQDKISEHTLEDDMRVPYVENGYWILRNKTSNANDKYDAQELVEEGFMAFSIGVLDIENNIVYYYNYDI